MLMPKQIWRDVPGYEGLYQVSNTGKIRSLNYKGTGKTRKLKLSVENDGYCHINLYNRDKKRRTHKVHRLVALAFIPNPNNYPIINHRDENRSNNCVWNLEWCTYVYNNNYGTRNKKLSEAKKGESNPAKRPEVRAKISAMKKGKYLGANNPKAKKVQCIETGQIFGCIKEAQQWLGKDIYRALKRGSRAGGYHWKYID